MLLSAPPLEQAPPRKVSLVMYTGRFSPLGQRADRGAAEVGAGRVAAVADEPRVDDLELAAAGRRWRPRRSPPKSSLVCWPVELPSSKVMFCTIRRGHCWLKQSELVVPCAGSQVFMYRIRRAPPPLSVDHPAAVQDDLVLVLRDLGRGVHGDRHRARAAVEGDDAARGHGRDDGRRGAAGGGAVADDVVRVAGADRPPGGRHIRLAGRVAGGRQPDRRRGRGLGLGLGAGELDIAARATAELAAPATAAPAPGDAALVAPGDAPPHAASVTPDANAMTSAVAPPLSRTRPHARSSTRTSWRVRDQ